MFRIAVRKINDGAFSTFANTELKAGDVLDVSKPIGAFSLEKAQGKTYVGIAAGSGITPIMSMIRTVLQGDSDSKFFLYYGNRDAEYNLLILGMYDEPALDDEMKHWVRGFSAAVQPHSTGGVYVNYMSNDEADRVGAAYGSRHYERLAAIKKKYDPDNLFRLNQNIAPAN